MDSAIGDNEFKVSREINLLNSLLSFVVNPADTMARVTIAFLTKEGYGAAEILDRRFEDLSNGKKDSDYLEDVPLVKELMAKRDGYKSLSVSALVENIIIELDLYNIVKSWPDSDNSVNTFHTLISIAKVYEDHCIQMSLFSLRLTRFAATVANVVFAPSAAPPFADACIPARFSPVGALTAFRIVYLLKANFC